MNKMTRIMVVLMVSVGELGATPIESLSEMMKKMPENIRLISGMENEQNYVIRLHAIHDLGTELSPREIDALLAFTAIHLNDQKKPGLKKLEFNGLKNELFIILMNQRIKPSLGGALIAMLNDREMDITWRDYCVQFMGQWYFMEPDQKVRQQMLQTMQQSLSDNQKSIAGTALTSLFSIYLKTKIGGEELAQKAVSLLQDESTHNLTKISALDIAARFKRPEALEEARKLLKDASKTDKTVLMVAIATIGTLGNSSDLAMLEEMGKSYDSRMRIPVVRATALINHRQKHQNNN